MRLMSPQEFVTKARGRLRIHLMQLRRWRLIRRVKARKRALAQVGETYTDTPAVSLVIQSFNHRKNIAGIVSGVRRTAADELIVCEDGSVDGSEAEWAREMMRPNDFIIRSNDLHEIRTYNRAISLARGEIVGIMQDDDIPPEDGRWVADAVRLFEAHPDLVVLGCAGGCVPGGTDGEPIYPGASSNQPSDEIPHRDPTTGLPFMFVDAAWIGPMFFRRDAYLALGGFDPRFSGPGEPGIWLDYDISLRAWLSGKQVGISCTAPFRRRVGGQGTLMFTGGKRAENYRKNQAYVVETYGPVVDDVHRAVAALNLGLASPGAVSAAM